jgi:hypothetical protein
MLGIVHEQIISNRASRGTLAKATYREIAERLGDREKDIALRWWISVKSDIDTL